MSIILIRDQKMTRVPFAKYESSYKSPKVCGVRFFNLLPIEIKNISNFKSFKIFLKQYLVNKCFYSVNEFLQM